MDFKDKVAIVTGGAQGIGFGYCSRLLKEGMKVCLCDLKINTPELTTLFPSYEDRVIIQKCDVTSFDNLKEAFDKTMQTFGKIDLVVNNAGIIDERNFKKCVDVNVVGVINGITLGFQYMGINNGGSGGFIVNTGSMSALALYPFYAVYTATKHAVVGLTKNFGADYHFKKTGVKVACICPAPVRTSIVNGDAYPLTKEEFKEVESSFEYATVDEVAEGLITILKEGRNGSILKVEQDSAKFVE